MKRHMVIEVPKEHEGDAERAVDRLKFMWGITAWQSNTNPLLIFVFRDARTTPWKYIEKLVGNGKSKFWYETKEMY